MISIEMYIIYVDENNIFVKYKTCLIINPQTVNGKCCTITSVFNCIYCATFKNMHIN